MPQMQNDKNYTTLTILIQKKFSAYVHSSLSIRWQDIWLIKLIHFASHHQLQAMEGIWFGYDIFAW